MTTLNSILVYNGTTELTVDLATAQELGMRILDRPRPVGFHGHYHVVVARYGYTPSEDYAHRIYVQAGEERDATEINNLGTRGAYCTTADLAGIHEAIALLRAELGTDLPVAWNLTTTREAQSRG